VGKHEAEMSLQKPRNKLVKNIEDETW